MRELYYIDQIMPLQVCFSALLLTEKLCSSCLYFFPLDQIEVALVFSDQNVEQLVRFSELLASSLSFQNKSTFNSVYTILEVRCILYEMGFKKRDNLVAKAFSCCLRTGISLCHVLCR